MAEIILLKVADRSEEQRLDTFVAQSIPDTSRSQVRRWIDSGCVLVNGKTRKAGYTVLTGQTVQVSPLPPEPSHLVPENLPIEIVYEDSDLLVVNKPAGMVVHPGSGNRTGTLANALAYHLEQLSRKDPMRPGIVHRLDKGTSGLLLVAKNETVHDRLTRQFQQRKVHKVYLTLLFGRLVPEKGEVAVPIGRDVKSRTRISTRTNRPRNAVTRYEVIRYFRNYSFVRAFPVTGRTHQIRVHFYHVGHPVVGDPTYIRRSYARPDPGIAALGRLFLHATRIEFRHPTRGETMVFEAPLPVELAEVIETLGE